MTKHNWNSTDKCETCGANRGEYDRDETAEAYADPSTQFAVALQKRRYHRDIVSIVEDQANVDAPAITARSFRIARSTQSLWLAGAGCPSL